MSRYFAVARVVHPRYLGRFRLVRKATLVRRYGGRVRDHLPYVLTDPEVDNFTYDIANEAELVAWLSSSLAADPAVIRGYIDEARCSPFIAECLSKTRGRFDMKPDPPLGRRLGWYAIVRALKPRRVIETGTHDGLGSVTLLAALERNAAEGYAGTLLSLDIDPHAGWLVGEHPRWEKVTGDAKQTVPQVLSEPADVFLHDSAHDAGHERFEVRAAIDAGVPVVISDNSHVTDVLYREARDAGMTFTFWREAPAKHFYTGAGIGLALDDGAGNLVPDGSGASKGQGVVNPGAEVHGT